MAEPETLNKAGNTQTVADREEDNGSKHPKRHGGSDRTRVEVTGNGVGQRIGKMIDPWQYWGSFGISLRKPGPVTFDACRHIAHTCEPIAAIVLTRQNQVASFSERIDPGEDKQPGWRIVPKKRGAEMTEEMKARIAKVERFFEKMYAEVPKEVEERLVKGTDYPETTFDGMLRMMTRDRLVLDAIAGEKVRDGEDRLFSVWMLDAARVWRAFPKFAKEDGPGTQNVSAALDSLTWMKDRTANRLEAIEDIEFVQEYRGREWVGWPRKDFMYSFANPRTDMGAYGYGYGEIEMLVGIVTGILNAVSYNKAQFSMGSLPPGFLSLNGNWDETMVEAFKREMEARLQGAANQQRLPVLWSNIAGEGAGSRAAEWINTRAANREMEYSQWLDWLLNIACAIFQIAPEEINIKSWDGGGGAPMFEKGPLVALKHSKDKGLKPLLRYIASVLTREIVEELDPELAFAFVNVDPEDETVRTDLAMKRISGGYETVNMARKKNNEKPIEESWADAPANPVLMQVWSMEKQQAMQQQQMGQEAPEDQAQGAQRFTFEPGGEEGQPGEEKPDEAQAAGPQGALPQAPQAQPAPAPVHKSNSRLILPETLNKSAGRIVFRRGPQNLHPAVDAMRRLYGVNA